MIHGMVRIPKFVQEDWRGRFEKYFSGNDGLPERLTWRESFSSVSKQGTIRGMHLQVPPYENYRLVSCSEGQILDVCVDLRAGSPSRGKVYGERLDAETPHSLLIPPGVAHGFLATHGPARVIYFSSSIYSAEHDTGVAWDSLDFDWEVQRPIVSERDRLLTPLRKFESPFKYQA